jgi:peptidoglycan/LPS O-acetylase OafA/YrhL
VLVVVGIYVGLRRKLNACEAGAGVCLWWLLAAVAAAVWLPEGSYLIFWPAALGWLVFGFTARRTWGPSVALAGLPSVLAVILLAPLLYELTVAFPGSQPFVVLCAAPLLALALPALDALLPAQWTYENRI